MSPPTLNILDLREQPRPDLLAAFVELYTRTFTDPSEYEDPGLWPLRLHGDRPEPQPRMHLLVAVDSSGPETRLLGGIAFEYYRASRCGLLTYLAVKPAERRRGVAKQLIRGAITLLHRDACDHGAALRGVFGETEDPDQVNAQDNAISPRDRLAVLERLGARRIDIPYVQPALQGGSGRCRHLLLFAFYLDNTQNFIEGCLIRDFLHEFYLALGIAEPEADADFITMARHLEKTLPHMVL